MDDIMAVFIYSLYESLALASPIPEFKENTEASGNMTFLQ